VATLEERSSDIAISSEEKVLLLVLDIKRVFTLSTNDGEQIARGLIAGVYTFGSLTLQCDFSELRAGYNHYVRAKVDELRAKYDFAKLTDHVAKTLRTELEPAVCQMLALVDPKFRLDAKAFFDGMGIWAPLLMGSVRPCVAAIGWCGLAHKLSCYDGSLALLRSERRQLRTQS